MLFLAAMVGGAAVANDSAAAECEAAGNRRSRPLWRTGMAALAAGMTASAMFGALPWSSPTLTEVVYLTYAADGGSQHAGRPMRRLAGERRSQPHRDQGWRKELLRLGHGSNQLHLLAIRRLDTVGQAYERWEAFQKEVGAGRSPIELFDWVVLDTRETFCQSPTQLQFVIDSGRHAQYQLVQSEHGILVFARPSVFDRSSGGGRGS